MLAPTSGKRLGGKEKLLRKTAVDDNVCIDLGKNLLLYVVDLSRNLLLRGRGQRPGAEN